MTILESIHAAAKKKGVTIKQIEQDLGFGNGSIAKTNEKTQIDRIIQIANYLDVPVEELCGDIVKKINTKIIDDRARERVDYLLSSGDHQSMHMSDNCTAYNLSPECYRRFLIYYEKLTKLSQKKQALIESLIDSLIDGDN